MSGAITHGMDIGEVRRLAVELTKAASDIELLTRNITAKLHSTPWSGPDRQRFESDWNGEHTRQLRTVIQALNDAATTAKRNAAGQEAASNAT